MPPPGGRPPVGPPSASTTSPGRWTLSTSWPPPPSDSPPAGALAGTSDHGTTKSLYGKDPDGLEFEIVWLIPADLLDDSALAARKQIGRLDLDAERQRYGGQTRGGVGISVPA